MVSMNDAPERFEYRFVGKKLIWQGKPAKFGDVLELTERQAQNLGAKVRRVGQEQPNDFANAPVQMRAEATEIAQRILDEAKQEAEEIVRLATEAAEAMVNNARLEAQRITLGGKAAVTAILDDATKPAVAVA